LTPFVIVSAARLHRGLP